MASHASAPACASASEARAVKTQWVLWLCLMGLSCRTPEPAAPPPPTLVMQLEDTPEPPVLAPERPARVAIELAADAGSLSKLQREVLLDGDLPLADAQTFGDPYSEHEGIFTFRGGPRRSGGAFGVIPRKPSKLTVAWSLKTGEGRAPWYGGTGWTGQPVIVRWPAVMRHSMPKLKSLRDDDDFVEVIQGSLDGSVHFIDLATGKRSRPALVTGNSIKGSVSLDPRGYPLLFVGQGIPQTRPIGLRVFELINHTEVFFLPGSDKAAPRRGWGAFDSSGLLNRATDTYVVGGENGLLYLIKLNTDFDPLALTLHVKPEVARYRYKSPGLSHFGIENSLSVVSNLAFFADNGGTLQAVDLRTMTPRWKFEAGDDTDATLALELEGERPKLYTGTEVDKTGPRGTSWLRRIDGFTGTADWQVGIKCSGALAPKKIDAGVFSTPTLGSGEVSDLVFFSVSRCPGGEDGVLLALDKRTGREVWRVLLAQFSWSTPTLLTDEDGHAWLLHGGIGGRVRLHDARTGKEVASVQLQGDIEATPSVFNGRAVLGTRANRIYGIDIR
ncbi:MAG: pyrrolo-quinoline quinone [Archangium gephyra]|uniref:Pyrrolo-quinoline quinone n=1 Tax=Archangium gephyra TaxID=48 RepID=A0A2W5VRK6_9BACT|nr:MAG: pyrrolo-quinoline quinone [Archangium gephyra]